MPVPFDHRTVLMAVADPESSDGMQTRGVAPHDSESTSAIDGSNDEDGDVTLATRRVVGSTVTRYSRSAPAADTQLDEVP